MTTKVHGIMGAKSSRHIDMNESHEVRYWAAVLDVSETDLISIVSKVGNAIDDIRRETAKAA